MSSRLMKAASYSRLYTPAVRARISSNSAVGVLLLKIAKRVYPSWKKMPDTGCGAHRAGNRRLDLYDSLRSRINVSAGTVVRVAVADSTAEDDISYLDHHASASVVVQDSNATHDEIAVSNSPADSGRSRGSLARHFSNTSSRLVSTG